MSDLLEKINTLKGLSSSIHWFCGRDEGSQQDSANTNSGILRPDEIRNLAFEAVMVFSFDGPSAEEPKRFMKDGITRNLLRCEHCIYDYYKGKQKLLEGLKEDGFEPDQIETFAEWLDDQAIERVTRGLQRAIETLRSKTPDQYRPSILSRSNLMSMIECLYCDRFLLDEDKMTTLFDEPFRLCQQRSRLSPIHLAPAMVCFAFGENDFRRSWALEEWRSMLEIDSQEDFDIAFRPFLPSALRQMAAFPITDFAFPTRFWVAMVEMTEKLSPSLITNGLRSLDLDVCKLTIEYLNCKETTYIPLMQFITVLLEKSPRDYWDAMGTISPQSIIEGIFHNTVYDQTLMSSTSDIHGGSDSVQALTGWVKPFMLSVQSSNQPPACRLLVSHYLQRLQDQRFPLCARKRCYEAGLNVLKWVMILRLRQDIISDAVSRAVATNLLAIVSEYLDDIITKIEDRELNGLNSERIREICIDAVRAALTLECRLLRIDHVTLSKNKHLTEGSKHVNLGGWKKVVPHIRSNATTLALAALPATTELSDLGQFGPKGHESFAQERKRFNEQFKECIDLISRVFESIGDMPQDKLADFVQEDAVRPALVAALMSSEDTLYQAAMDVAKGMSGELMREDALRHLLKPHLASTLNDISDTLDRISANGTFYSCPRMLKTTKDILGILCDPQDGILRHIESNTATSTAVVRYWKSQWRALTIIYEMTERWASEHDKNILKEFCRDVMQFSARLFDEYPVFQTTAGSEEDIDDDDSRSKDLLIDPSRTMDSMVVWLRLRDEYLASTAVAIIRKLIGQLCRHGMEASEDATTFLLRIITDDIRTNLSAQQKAEIHRALDGEDVNDLSLSTVAPKTTTKSSEKYPPVLPSRSQSQKYKAQPLDLKAWAAKAQSVSRDDQVTNHARGEGVISSRTKETSQLRAALEKQSKLQAKLKPTQAQQALLHKQEEIRKNNEAKQNSFLEKRRQEQEEKRKNNASIAARLKSQNVSTGSGIAGAGSALSGLGDQGKDHSRAKGTGMLLSSDEESDDDDDMGLFARKALKSSAAFKDLDALRKLTSQTRGPVKKVKQARSVADMRARLTPNLAPLHRMMLAWDLFTRGDFPPGTARNDYDQVQAKFRTPIDYQKCFEPLLLLEAWQGFQQTLEEGLGKTFHVQFSTRVSVDSLIEISTVIDGSEMKAIGLSESDIVVLSADKDAESSSHRCLARISKVGRHRQQNIDLTFRVAPENNSLLKKFVAKADIYGAKLGSLTPLEREYSALSGLQYYDLCDEIIKAAPSPLLTYSEEKMNKISRMYDLNLAQAKAVQSAFDNDAFTLIQGPPGSGKTKTIVSIVGALLTGTLKKSHGIAIKSTAATSDGGNAPGVAAKKLLVCAPSNAAVDELVIRLMKGVKTFAGERHNINVIRLGRSDKINAKVASVTLDELVSKEMGQMEKKDQEQSEISQAMSAHKQASEEISKLREAMDEADQRKGPRDPQMGATLESLKRRRQQLSTRIDQLKDSGNSKARESEVRRAQMQQRILDSAHVLCATLSGSGHDMFQKLKIDFETVIIDEAAQSVELSALIPLKYGCQKCVMVGDPKQLPPTVLSREAARFQYEQSLFVRMQNNAPEDVHLLDTQYRMHPDISSFPSQAFYDGRLLDGKGLVELRRKYWHEDKYLGPYKFFDVKGQQASGPTGHSLINMAEVEAAFALYKRLTKVAADYDFNGKIGIITPYKSQLQRLKDHFKRHTGDERILDMIDFNTTDAFQGREAEVIIFSCVRASEGGIGFLSDIRRMNVGITRAQCSLWVLGNINSLQRGEYWRKMITNAKERNLVVEGNITKLVSQGAKMLKSIETEKIIPTRRPSYDSPTSPIDIMNIKRQSIEAAVELDNSSTETKTMTSSSVGEIQDKRKRSMHDLEREVPAKSPRIEAIRPDTKPIKSKYDLSSLDEKTENGSADKNDSIAGLPPVATKKPTMKPPPMVKKGPTSVFMQKKPKKR